MKYKNFNFSRFCNSKQISPELRKCYFLYIQKQISLKMPILLYFVGPKRPPGNCYINCFLTEKSPLNLNMSKDFLMPMKLKILKFTFEKGMGNHSQGFLHHIKTNFRWPWLQRVYRKAGNCQGFGFKLHKNGHLEICSFHLAAKAKDKEVEEDYTAVK